MQKTYKSRKTNEEMVTRYSSSKRVQEPHNISRQRHYPSLAYPEVDEQIDPVQRNLDALREFENYLIHHYEGDRFRKKHSRSLD